MPLYEYVCEACGKHFELIRKFSDPPVESCFTCGGPVRKLLSSPAIQFKGSGWYITDYARKDKAATSEEKPAEEKPAAASAGAAKTDSSSSPSKTGPSSSES